MSQQKPNTTASRSSLPKLLPAPKSGGFMMDGYWVWCGSVIWGEDGRYHMYASRWPQELAFHPHWLTHSEVVHATADKPEGPYTFEQVVLPARGPEYWDGRMTHNPTIHRCGSTYLLFYTGTTFEEPYPTVENPSVQGDALMLKARRNQRIGLATAPSPEGPWTRLDQPIMEPRPGHWDGLITTNPAPCVLADGRVLLIYKSTRSPGDLLRFGVAMADHYMSPYRRLSDEQILDFDATGDHVEDPYVWQAPDGHFEMIMKDMEGGLGGEARAVIHARSDDGIDWHLCDPALAYRRTLTWDDGSVRTHAFFERPQLLIEDGRPTTLFAAIGESPVDKNDHSYVTKSWNAAIPLQS